MMGHRSRVALGWVGLVLGVGISVVGAEDSAGDRTVTIRGTVRDEAGTALAEYPVRLIKTKTIINLFRFSTNSQLMEDTRTRTDQEGNYEIRIVPDPKYDYFYLRFYEAETFDPVRYRVPADRDITRELKEKPEVVVDETIELNPDWPQVENLVGKFGAGSNRGRILLALGLPERREILSQTAGRENWWYYAKGICYQLREDEVLKIRRYDPVLPPPGSA